MPLYKVNHILAPPGRARHRSGAGGGRAGRWGRCREETYNRPEYPRGAGTRGGCPQIISLPDPRVSTVLTNWRFPGRWNIPGRGGRLFPLPRLAGRLPGQDKDELLYGRGGVEGRPRVLARRDEPALLQHADRGDVVPGGVGVERPMGDLA